MYEKNIKMLLLMMGVALLGICLSLNLSAQEVNFRNEIPRKNSVRLVNFDFIEELRMTLNAAVMQWNGAVHDGFLYTTDDKIANIMIGVGPLPFGVLGVAFPNGKACAITLAPEAITNIRVVMHEIGHCLGFKHSDDDQSLMFWLDQDGNWLTQEMLDIIQERMPPEELSPEDLLTRFREALGPPME